MVETLKPKRFQHGLEVMSVDLHRLPTRKRSRPSGASGRDATRGVPASVHRWNTYTLPMLEPKITKSSVTSMERKRILAPV